jgi:hypothetical protein
MSCPNCGAPIDMRYLGEVPSRDIPLHIEQGRRNKRAAIRTDQSVTSIGPAHTDAT